MPDWSKPVFSSVVSEIEYREEGNQLLVKWIKGRTSIYSPVPEEIALQAANAPSVNGYLNMEVKPFYSHRYA